MSEMVIDCIDWLALITSKRATAVPSVSSVTKLISARRRLATLGRTKVLPSATRTHVPHSTALCACLFVTSIASDHSRMRRFTQLNSELSDLPSSHPAVCSCYAVLAY